MRGGAAADGREQALRLWGAGEDETRPEAFAELPVDLEGARPIARAVPDLAAGLDLGLLAGQLRRPAREGTGLSRGPLLLRHRPTGRLRRPGPGRSRGGAGQSGRGARPWAAGVGRPPRGWTWEWRCVLGDCARWPRWNGRGWKVTCPGGFDETRGTTMAERDALRPLTGGEASPHPTPHLGLRNRPDSLRLLNDRRFGASDLGPVRLPPAPLEEVAQGQDTEAAE